MAVIIENIANLLDIGILPKVTPVKLINNKAASRVIPLGIPVQNDGNGRVCGANLVRLVGKSIQNMIASINGKETDFNFEQFVAMDE